MKEADLRAFLEGLVDYFEQNTRSEANILAPYLISDVDSLLLDYSGRIQITGGYIGNVLFTAPHRMLIALLARYGHRETDNSYLLDLVGEISNTIAGKAQQSASKNFEISVPLATRAKTIDFQSPIGLKNYCIPVQWEQQEARLIIAVTTSQ